MVDSSRHQRRVPSETLIDRIEHDFLCGRFRKALVDGNAILSLPQTNCSRNKILEHHVGSFCLWDVSYELNVHRQKPNQYDRVAAVVLQAWYELWREEGSKGDVHQSSLSANIQAKKHLLPFLQSLCSRESSVSVELAWLWLQLLWRLDQNDASLRLSLRLLHVMAIMHDSRESQMDQGLFFLVGEALPHVSLSTSDSFWESWFKSLDDSDFIQTKCRKLLDQPSVESVRSLQESVPLIVTHFCLNGDNEAKLKNQLEALLLKCHSNRLTMRRELVENRKSVLFGRVARLLHQWIAEPNVNPLSFSSMSPQNRAVALTIFVVSVWASWRSSRRVSALLRRLFQLALSPTMELIEAVTPRIRQNQG